MKRYKFSRRWADRASCVHHCMKYAKTNEDAYQVGIIALQDKSKTVRHQACMLLSAASKKNAIEPLEKLLSDEASRDDAAAAIDVLLNLDHN
jgi:HEAT repeat protein